MEGEIPSTPSDDWHKSRDITRDDEGRPLEDAESREDRFHKLMNDMYGQITFRKVMNVIKKSVKRRLRRVHHSVVVSGALHSSDLEESSLNIEHANIKEMAEFELPCN